MPRFPLAALGACLVAVFAAACSTSSTSPGTTPTSPPLLYFVSDANSNAVTAYPLTANGNVAPTQNIVGAATGLGFPRRVVLDSTMNIYIANAPGGAVAHSITVYAPAATGNVAPIRTITGAATGLTGVDGLALDGSGNLFATNCGLCFNSTGSDGILIFPAGANGNIAPTNSIAGAATTLNGPTSLTFDAGGNLLVTNSGNNAVLKFASGASGNVAPTATIVGAATGLADPECVRTDAAGLIYVCSNNNSTIAVFAAGANGNVAPMRTLSGAATGLLNPTSVSFDTTGNMYVANAGGNTITVYAPGATGNQAPMFTVSGAATGLVTPIGLAIQ